MAYDFIIVGGGSAGCALANRLSADARQPVLVLEAGRTTPCWDIFIHMPAALTCPIGSRFYDWHYESEPEPHMNGRRVYHARGKVLGGSSSINGMIFQRGNPLDFERWAADPGMAVVGLRALPAVLQEDGDVPRRRGRVPRRRRPLKLERGPATNPLFTAFFQATQQAGYSLTERRQRLPSGGLRAFDRNIRRGRRLSAARAYLHPVMERPNLERQDARADHARIALRGHPRGRCRIPLGQVLARAGSEAAPPAWSPPSPPPTRDYQQ